MQLAYFSYQFLYVINSSTLETEESSSDSQDSMQSGYTGDQAAASCSKSLRCSYILVGDNIDKTVTARHMTMDHQSQSLHYFHCYAALDRIYFHDLDNSSPIGSVDTLPLETFFPSMEDCDALRNNYVVLLAREIVDKVPHFEVFADSVPEHIVHQYTEELSCKSSIVSRYCICISTNRAIDYFTLYPYAYFQVPLGVLPHSETSTEGMVNILDLLNQYIPEATVDEHSKILPLAMGGDMLTAARVRTAQDVRVSSSGKEALCGYTAFPADWHAKVNFMMVRY